MRFLFAGLGSMGIRHLRNLKTLTDGEFLAYRVRGGNEGDIVREFGITTFFDLEEALSKKPDAVFIANPTSLHISVAIAAAKMGCHLFIEKPLSHSTEDIDKLMSIVKEKKLIVFIGYNLRFHPNLRLIKDFLDENKIGKVTSARIVVGEYLPQWHPWEDYSKGYSARKDLGGGVLLTLSHELDYAYWLFGGVKRIACFAAKLSGLQIDVEDTAQILLEFQNGIVTQVHMDYIQRPPIRTCHITGENGAIFWDYYQSEVRLYQANEEQYRTFRVENFERNEMYIEEMKHFLACLAGKERPLIGIEDGEKVLAIALAAKKSMAKGKVITLQTE